MVLLFFLVLLLLLLPIMVIMMTHVNGGFQGQGGCKTEAAGIRSRGRGNSVDGGGGGGYFRQQVRKKLPRN